MQWRSKRLSEKGTYRAGFRSLPARRAPAPVCSGTF